MPVDELAADDAPYSSGLAPMLSKALVLIRVWSSDYKTVASYWVLNATDKAETDYFTGLGYWTRAGPEQCSLATRGKPPRRAKDVGRSVVDRRREHSRKPDVLWERHSSPGTYTNVAGKLVAEDCAKL
jgi:N6-adenosine-specific RNA methylase IME4